MFGDSYFLEQFSAGIIFPMTTPDPVHTVGGKMAC